MTSGRILQEIHKAITDSGYNYVVDEITEITYDSSSGQPAAPSATDVSPDILFVHVVDTKSENPNLPYYELLKKIQTSDTPTYAYVCNQVPVSAIVLDSRSEHKDIYTLYKYVEEVPASSEPVPHYYQEWIKTNSAYNYVVNQLTTIEYTSPASPIIPTPTATSADVIFVNVVDQKEESPNDPYYELLVKIKVDDTPTYAYKCYQAPISSIVLDLTNQDIYTLYNYVSAVPSTGEVVPNNYQNWIKTDRFNEDLQINLTHTPISLTTKGDVQIDGDSKLTIKELPSYHQTPDTTTYTELTKTDILLTKATTTNTITETQQINITSDEKDQGVSTNNAIINVSYDYKDSAQSDDNHTDSVIISSHDDSVDPSNPGASIVLTGDHSYIETPILRLKIVE